VKYEVTVSRSSRATPKEKIGGSVVPRASLDALEERQIICLSRFSNPALYILYIVLIIRSSVFDSAYVDLLDVYDVSK
jgi:hypothetical protein